MRVNMGPVKPHFENCNITSNETMIRIFGKSQNIPRGRVARKFNDKPNWNRGKDAST